MDSLTNLRGGGESGKAWHEAGMRKNKQNVFDDFIAAAAGPGPGEMGRPGPHRHPRRKQRRALVGAAMVQRPDLFRAVVCAIPLLDMVRYAQFASGRTWADEYGDPSVEADFRCLFAYSPYHHVVPGEAYPACSCSPRTTTTGWTMHARKFAAWGARGNRRPAAGVAKD